VSCIFYFAFMLCFIGISLARTCMHPHRTRTAPRDARENIDETSTTV
jgi:hypothetical protein